MLAWRIFYPPAAGAGGTGGHYDPNAPGAGGQGLRGRFRGLSEDAPKVDSGLQSFRRSPIGAALVAGHGDTLPVAAHL